jgi:NADPH:quinone reductase-like Zn-dependent oxidoreductase
VWDELMAWHADGDIRPVIDRDVGLADVAVALTDLAERRVTGKVVVRPAAGVDSPLI